MQRRQLLQFCSLLGISTIPTWASSEINTDFNDQHTNTDALPIYLTLHAKGGWDTTSFVIENLICQCPTTNGALQSMVNK